MGIMDIALRKVNQVKRIQDKDKIRFLSKGKQALPRRGLLFVVVKHYSRANQYDGVKSGTHV